MCAGIHYSSCVPQDSVKQLCVLGFNTEAVFLRIQLNICVCYRIHYISSVSHDSFKQLYVPGLCAIVVRIQYCNQDPQDSVQQLCFSGFKTAAGFLRIQDSSCVSQDSRQQLCFSVFKTAVLVTVVRIR